MTLQDRLAELFTEFPHLKPAHLAKAAGVSRTTVASWLHGRVKSIYDRQVERKAADFFGVNVAWLVEGIGEKYASNNKDLLDKPNNEGQEALKEKLRSSLEKDTEGAILADTTSTNIKTREEIMHLDYMKKMRKIDDGNIIHAISLLLSINNAIDKDQQIIEAINALCLTTRDNIIDIKITKDKARDTPKAVVKA